MMMEFITLMIYLDPIIEYTIAFFDSIVNNSFVYTDKLNDTTDFEK